MIDYLNIGSGIIFNPLYNKLINKNLLLEYN